MNQYGYSATSSGNNATGQPQHLTSLPNLSSQNYQQDSPASSHILPPIHTQTNGISAPYPHQLYRNAAVASAPHTPRTPHTPGTPVNGGSATSLSHIAPQQSQVPGQQQHAYPPIVPAMTSQAPMSFNMSGQPQNGTPAPASTAYNQMPQMFSQLPPVYGMDQSRPRNNVPPSLLPPPPQTVGNTMDQMQPQRLAPVVGSQGRRGILPSAPGRPTIGTLGDGSAARAALNPVNKTADGKFPCSYCNKTYLHLKHLKRHLLRHTGERPYQCSLCGETFCRSDILKRHFAKCSVRRGNPHNLTHLTHAQAHLRPQQQQQQQMPPQQPGGAPPNGLGMSSAASSMAGNRSSWPNGMTNPPYATDAPQLPLNGLQVDSNRSSRSNSIIRPASSGSDDKKRFSNASSLHTVTNSLETSPPHSAPSVNGAGIEHKFDAANFQRDRLHGQAYPNRSSPGFYQQAVSNGTTSMNGQSEQPQVKSEQSQFYYPYQYGASQQQDDNNFSGYFPAGNDNSLMFSAQQS